jgi:hypothetical protein
VLEDSWAAVLRCGKERQPVTATSLMVMGQDHARLQASERSDTHVVCLAPGEQGVCN